MAKLIPAAERIIRARKLLQQTRALPVPTEGTRQERFLLHCRYPRPDAAGKGHGQIHPADCRVSP